MNVEALKELTATVKADKVPSSALVCRALGKWAGDWKTTDLVDWILSPHDLRQMGAAKALHDAVLPGWWWVVGSNSTSVYKSKHDDMISCGLDGMSPARRWLLAILRALISQAQNSTEGDAT